ncbi:MAG: DUF4956 domain-containing protein [Bacteriovoracaceae bacterium]
MDINHLIKSIFISDTNALGVLDIFLAITFPFILCLFIGYFYKRTNYQNHYSINFILAIPLFGALTSIITLLIGSNIARAFGLVGALSLIRFRTAVKDPIDSIYLFWALGVGMACGTGFYLAAIAIVLLGITYMAILYKIKFAQSERVNLIVKAFFSKSADESQIKSFEKECESYFSSVNPLNIYTSSQSDENEFVYSCQLKKRMGTTSLVEELKKNKDVKKVEVLSQDSALYL